MTRIRPRSMRWSGPYHFIHTIFHLSVSTFTTTCQLTSSLQQPTTHQPRCVSKWRPAYQHSWLRTNTHGRADSAYQHAWLRPNMHGRDGRARTSDQHTRHGVTTPQTTTLCSFLVPSTLPLRLYFPSSIPNIRHHRPPRPSGNGLNTCATPRPLINHGQCYPRCVFFASLWCTR